MEFPWNVLLVLAVPLALDVVSCGLDIRRRTKGRGPSGFPFVTLFLYALIIVNLKILPFGTRLAVLAAAALVHILITFLVPRFYSAGLRRMKGA